jgi:hypothetical protein
LIDENFDDASHKKALTGLFVLKPTSLGKPGLNGRGAVLRFPFLGVHPM